MRCYGCNRPLIAMDAKVVAGVGSEATVELECECGTKWIHIIDDDEWFEEHPGMLHCSREFLRTDSGIIRWLSATLYGSCPEGDVPKHFVFRLSEFDRRPFGMEMTGMSHLADQLLALPLGRWMDGDFLLEEEEEEEV